MKRRTFVSGVVGSTAFAGCSTGDSNAGSSPESDSGAQTTVNSDNGTEGQEQPAGRSTEADDAGTTAPEPEPAFDVTVRSSGDPHWNSEFYVGITVENRGNRPGRYGSELLIRGPNSGERHESFRTDQIGPGDFEVVRIWLTPDRAGTYEFRVIQQVNENVEDASATAVVQPAEELLGRPFSLAESPLEAEVRILPYIGNPLVYNPEDDPIRATRDDRYVAFAGVALTNPTEEPVSFDRDRIEVPNGMLRSAAEIKQNGDHEGINLRQGRLQNPVEPGSRGTIGLILEVEKSAVEQEGIAIDLHAETPTRGLAEQRVLRDAGAFRIRDGS